MTDYSLEGVQWTEEPITWSFETFGYSSDSSLHFSSTIAAEYQQTVIMAFAAWAAVANLTFQEVPDNASPSQAADIRLGFANIANGSEIGLTAYNFTGSSFLPDVSVYLEDPAADPLIPDADGSFTYQGTSTQLYQVVLHEIGHALGLNHSTDPNAVMYPVLGQPNQTLDASDIAGIDALYGSASITPAALGSPVFRFLNPADGSHFYTDNAAEIAQIQRTDRTWKLEGVAFDAVSPTSDDSNATPVYRFHDTQNGEHFYTASQSEISQVLRTLPAMKLEGIAFNEDATAQPGDAAVYRLYNAGNGEHFYTSNVAEMNQVISGSGMKLEGIAFYAPT